MEGGGEGCLGSADGGTPVGVAAAGGTARHGAGEQVGAEDGDREWVCGLCQLGRQEERGSRGEVLGCAACPFSCHLWCYHERGSPEAEGAFLRNTVACQHTEGAWQCGDCDPAGLGVTSVSCWYFAARHEQGFQLPEESLPRRSKCAWCGDWSVTAICSCGWRKAFRLRGGLTPRNFPNDIGSAGRSDMCACGGWVPTRLWTHSASGWASKLLEERRRGEPVASDTVVGLVQAFTADLRYRHGRGREGRERGGHQREPEKFATPFSGKAVGLPNLGNTCFVNAAVQMLARMGDLAMALAHAETTLGKHLCRALSWLQTTPVTNARGWKQASEAAITPLWLTLIDLGMIERGQGGDAVELITRIIQFLHTREPEPLSSTIRALFCNETLKRVRCIRCGYCRVAKEEYWFREIPVQQGSGYEEMQTALSHGEVERIEVRCIWCGGQEAECQRVPRLAESSKYLLVYFKQGGTAGGGKRGGGVVRPVLSAEETQPVLTLRNDVHSQSWKLIGAVEHQPGHYVVHVKGPARSWFTVSDASVRPMEELPPRDLLATSYAYLYSRAPRQAEHSRCLERQEPCMNCDVPGCRNGFALEAVETRESAWLVGQRGLYAAGDIKEGEFLASFGVLRQTTVPGNRTIEVTVPGGRAYLRWPRAGGRYIGQVANSTCCKAHRNAKIVHNGQMGTHARVWLQAARDIKRGSEILVSYGQSFFRRSAVRSEAVQTARCVCCACEGRCRREDPTDGEGEGPPLPPRP